MSGAVRVEVVSGPLAPYAAGFGGELRARGYSPSAVAQRLRQVDQLSCWLLREGLAVGDLTAARAERFLAARRAAGFASLVSSRSMALPLEYLRAVGAVAVAAPVTEQGLVEDYRRYLVCERGLAASTVAGYERHARLFLAEHAGAGPGALARLSAADVSGFLVGECERGSASSAKYLACGLRSLLRYLHVTGVTATSLAWAVSGVAGQRGGTLPRGLERRVVSALLASCDRRRTVGLRDYAILLLLVRLGLRAGEVAALGLDDVDWRAGEILVCGKGDRRERLPLPVDVGQALAGYVRRRREESSRALFVRVIAPSGPLSARGVGAVVHDACARAAITPGVGPHRLRHTAATGMLREGASLPEIAQVLRHRRLATTAIYARVDRRALRALAQPWPGSAS